jgi:hypothetical protein
MRRRQRQSGVLDQALSGQEQLFAPVPPAPPTFDEMCPPGSDEQLELEVDAAIHAANQTTVYDFVERHV